MTGWESWFATSSAKTPARKAPGCTDRYCQLSLALQEVLAVDQFGAGASANFSERWSRYPVGTHRPANVGALQKEAIAFFEQKGWTHEQAIGLVANINAESGFDLRCVDDGGLAVGLAQWHPDRQAKMVAFAQYAAQHPDKYPEFKGANITKVMDANLEQQLSMMDYELRHGDEQRAGNVLQQQTSAAASAAAISTYYERPADKYGQAQHRAAEADGIAAAVPKTPNGPPLAGLKSRGEVPATAAPTTGTPAPEGVAPTAASAPTAHPLSPNAAA